MPDIGSKAARQLGNSQCPPFKRQFFVLWNPFYALPGLGLKFMVISLPAIHFRATMTAVGGQKA